MSGRDQYATWLDGLSDEALYGRCVHVMQANVGRREKTPDLVFGETTQIDPFFISVWLPRTSERSGQEQLDEIFDFITSSIPTSCASSYSHASEQLPRSQ